MIFGAGIFGYCLMIGGAWFLAMLATFAVVLLVGIGHYLFWGRTMQRARVARPTNRIETGHAERPIPVREPPR